LTWGNNGGGQLGDNTTTNRSSPGTTAGAGTNWKQVDGGQQHTVAIKTDGTLWTCGYSSAGALGTGNTTARSSPGTTAGGGTNWKQVACGLSFTAAIKTDGTLWTWGANSFGRLGDGTTTDRTSPVTTAGGGTNWKQWSGGLFHTAAIKTDGTLWTCGYNVQGQLGTGNTTDRSSLGTTAGGGTNWKQVACGSSFTAAIKTDGTLWTWGANNYGQLGTGNTTYRSSPGTTSFAAAWRQVSCGQQHIAAIETMGSLWTWGGNVSGQLGDNTTTSRLFPVNTIDAGTNWKEVSCGEEFSAAIKYSPDS